MLPYVHILLSDLKTWFFCQLYMFCGRGGVASGKVLREYWIFYTARRRRKNSEVLGIKMMPHIHILGFFWDQNGAIYTHFFLRSKCCKIYTFLSVFGQNATIYIHIWGFFGIKMLQHTHICVLFLGSKWYHIYTFCCFFFYQNAAIYIHILFFFVKMLQHIHICVGFWDQNATIYTHFGGFFGVKMLPYIHISGI